MSAESPVESTTDPHEGGFRPNFDVDTHRGGPHYGEFVEQVREFMDRVRAAWPDADLTADLTGQLKEINTRLAAVETDEWTSPSGTRIDLPARGNITLPPYEISDAGPDGVAGTITFTRFNLGGNGAAHGGYVALLFDDLGGMAAALHIENVCRTAYLKIDYRSLTPLNSELAVRCWIDRVEGRKVYARGTLHEGDRLCAEMDALFIELKPGQP